METSMAFKNDDIPVSVAMQKSSQTETDQALAILSANKDAWARMDIVRRIALAQADQIRCT